MNDPLSLRQRIQAILSTPGRSRLLLWCVAPLLCLIVPGLGAILAFVWIVALLWLGRQPVSILGLARPIDWTRTLVVAVAVAVGVSVLSNAVLEPLVQRVLGRAPDLSRIDDLTGHWDRLALLLGLSWLVGAVVEETVFRGFLIGYGARLLGERFVWPLTVASSVIFGFSHLYQGLAGMLLTGAVGFILSVVYVSSRRSLAVTMIAHGLIDTIGVVGIFLGFH